MINPNEVKPNEGAQITVTAPLLKLDLACGQVKAEGFTGVDAFEAPGVDIVHDLRTYPWPFEDNAVDEARCSHFFEHIPGPERPRFMEELYRVLKTGAGCMFITPNWTSARAYQDFTHAWPPVCLQTYFYFSREWRETNKLTHGFYDIKCDFEIRPVGQVIHPNWQVRHHEAQQFGATHYIEVVQDIIILVVKK